MHPDIYVFWEKRGYRLHFNKKDGRWFATKGSENIIVAYRSFLTFPKGSYPDYYIWNNQYVSEEFMLKLIKMKAFI